MMKKVLCGCVVAGLVAIAGCEQATGPAYKPAASKNTSEKVGDVTASDKFSLTGSWTSTTLKQGKMKDISIKVSKGKDFKKDIKLTPEPEKGLRIEPAIGMLKASDESGNVEFKVTADPEAPVGNLHIKVHSDPPADKVLDLTIKVEKP